MDLLERKALIKTLSVLAKSIPDPAGKADFRAMRDYHKAEEKRLKAQERVEAREQAIIDKAEGKKILKAMKKTARKKVQDYKKMISSGKIWTVD